MTYKDQLPAVGGNLFFDVQRFEHAQRIAKLLASSTMVPSHFRDNMGNCLIALNYAERLGADPFMVMQRMYVIQGKPGIEGQLVIALVNQSGRFEPLEFEEIGNINKPDKDTDGVYAYATEKRSGKVLKGPMVDWSIVKNEGWYNKNQSKWKTMSPLMFRYRAATFFARTYCPEVLLGMHTVEELRDVYDLRPGQNGTWEGDRTTPGGLADKLLNGGANDKQQDPEAAFRNEWIKIRASGFSTYVWKNLERFSKASAELQQEAREKWGKFYSEPFPLDRKDESENQQTAEPEQETEPEPERTQEPEGSKSSIWKEHDAIQKNDPDGYLEALQASGYDNEPGTETGINQVVAAYNRMFGEK